MQTPSPTSADRVELRVPRPLAIYAIAFLVVWCSMIAWIGIRMAREQPAGLLVLALLLAFGTTLCIRMARARAVGEGDELVVRNYLGSSRIRRSDVEAVRVGRYGGNPMQMGRCITVITPEEVVAIDATLVPGVLGIGRRRLERQREELAAWARV